MNTLPNPELRPRSHRAMPQLRALITVVLAMALPIPALCAQLVTPQPVIDEQPQTAAVLSGEGAAFSVVARAVGGFITRIDWHDGSGRLVQSGLSGTLARNAWTAADAGEYTATVHQNNGTSVTSRPARLVVLARGWAPVGGRALPGLASTRQPALELCGGPTVAWMPTNHLGRRDLRVHRFDGAQWKALGGSLKDSPSNNADDVSMQCVPSLLPGAPLVTPALAYSESWISGGSIAVKHWDGRGWVSVGQVPADPGASPRTPVLRLRQHPIRAPGDVSRNSWLTWLETTGLRAAAFGLSDWHDLTGGSLGWPGFGPPLMVLDDATRVPEGIIWSPMIATIVAGPMGNWPHMLQHGWSDWWWPLGHSFAQPVQNTVRAVGLGFTSEAGSPRVMFAWTEGSNPFTLRSVSLSGADYTAAIFPPFPQRSWSPYAADYTGTDLRLTAFDQRPFDQSCGANGPHSFTRRARQRHQRAGADVPLCRRKLAMGAGGAAPGGAGVGSGREDDRPRHAAACRSHRHELRPLGAHGMEVPALTSPGEQVGNPGAVPHIAVARVSRAAALC